MIIDNIIVIPGIANDSNYYVIDNEVLVDTGTGQNTQYLYSELKKNNINPEDIKLIVNTHCHYDHVGGNKDFPNAKVAIGKIDAQSVRDDNNPDTCCHVFNHAIERHDVDIELDEGDKIKNFEVLHTPGHSSGGICLWNGKTLICGDTVFAHGGIGRVDLGGDFEDMKKSVDRLTKLGVVNLLPGHGPIVEGDADVHLHASYKNFF